MAQGREANCRKLLTLTAKIRDDVQQIEDCKEAARADAEEHEEGFIVPIEGLGEVQVTGPTESKFKGIVYELEQETFIDLSEARRKKLIADGLVKEKREYSSPRKPSVTVRL